MRKYFDKHADKLYFVFRVLIGVLFLLHGLQKMQGIMDGKIMLLSLFGIAGLIEVIGGGMLILGLFTRYVAFITVGEMAVAYLYAHSPNGLNPLLNKGEASLLFFAAFLVLIGHGSGKWALDKN